MIQKNRKTLKNQRGYLTIVSIGIIIISAITSSLLINLFGSSIKGVENTSESNSSFFLAASGLQISKRDLIKYNKKCSDINGTILYTDASLPNIKGQYTVKCSTNIVNTTLIGDIDPSSSSITLQNTTTASNILVNSLSATDTTMITLPNIAAAKQFSVTDSMAKIDDEYILYNKRVGTDLIGLTRGVAGTTASIHTPGTVVSQGLLDSGVIIIDKESIGYNGISGNTLQNVTRGILGTTAASHSDSAIVVQNQCILANNAGIPNLNTPSGKCSVKETISPDIANELFFPFNAPLVSMGDVDLKDTATVKNLSVTSSDPNFVASTIVTQNNVNFIAGSSSTIISDGSGGEVVSSQFGDINADIEQNSTLFDSKSLYDYLFSVSLATIKNDAIIAADLNTALNTPAYTHEVVLIGGANFNTLDTIITTTNQPKILIIDGNLRTNAKNVKITVGTPNKPTILIVDGNLTIAGQYNNFTVHGILYVTGDLSATGTGSGSGGSGVYDNILNVIGFSGVEGNTKLYSDATIEMNHNYLEQLQKVNEYLSGLSYTKTYTSKEVFN